MISFQHQLHENLKLLHYVPRYTNPLPTAPNSLPHNIQSTYLIIPLKYLLPTALHPRRNMSLRVRARTRSRA